MQLLRIIQICRQIGISSEHKNKSANSDVRNRNTMVHHVASVSKGTIVTYST